MSISKLNVLNFSLMLSGLNFNREVTKSNRLRSRIRLGLFTVAICTGMFFTLFSFSGLDLEEVSWNVFVILFHVSSLAKLVVMYVIENELRWAYVVLNDDLNVETPNSKRIRRVFVTFVSLAFTVMVSVSLHPLVTGQPHFPLYGFLPFSTQEKAPYVFAYLLTTIITLVECYCHIVFDSIVAVYGYRIYNRIIKLCKRFRALKSYEELRENIIEHIEILRATGVFRMLISVPYFLLIFGSVAQFCMLAFLIARFENLSKSLLHGSIIIDVMSQVFIYCWIGQQLTNAFDDLHLACYDNYWYMNTLETRKLLAIVMTVTKKPVIFKGCYVVDMSYRMFLKRYKIEGEAFLDAIVTGDETRVCRCTLESKRRSKQWCHIHSTSSLWSERPSML
ncbi:hypothetical protein AAG570_006622 [Ranatra chinensis]|uniref:Odorant receptor n=1 Tax=Ranatra chinensis TaxID=642074 RepID=A0ABD0YUJ5_9HEMI